MDTLLPEVDAATGSDPQFDSGVDALRAELAAPDPARARRLAELSALCLQGSLLLRRAPRAVAEGFVASRFGDEVGRTLGALPGGLDIRTLVDRVTPAHP